MAAVKSVVAELHEGQAPISTGTCVGRCPSTVLRVAHSEPIQTVLKTNPNRTLKQSKPYSICTRTEVCFLSFSVRLTRKILQIGTFPFSNRTWNRTRIPVDKRLLLQELKPSQSYRETNQNLPSQGNPCDP